MKTHFLVLRLMVLIGVCLGGFASNVHVTPCTVKKWKIRVEKPPFRTPSGQLLQCKGDVVVSGCRGLCESFEVCIHCQNHTDYGNIAKHYNVSQCFIP
jgi:hypothetical protein